MNLIARFHNLIGSWRSARMPLLASVIALSALAGASSAHAAGVYGRTTGLGGGYRWDAAPRTIGGQERSLQGGLRYSMQGGSFQAYRDQFSWDVVPSVATFQQTVEQALNAWTVADPVTGLTTSLSFVADLNTTAVGAGEGGGINTAGAEIDLLGYFDGTLWNPGDTGQRAETFFDAVGGTTTLTSGTTGYAAGAISGADIALNRGATYNIDVFRLLLTHEIGHTLGLADVDVQAGPGGFFIDDNYNGATNATALATLTNSWALLVDPLNPANSTGLSLYNVLNGQPGFDTPGVNILMESEGLGGQYGNLTPLSNDDYGGRQFLYPTLIVVPEAGTAQLLAGAGALALGSVVLRRRRKA